MSDQDLLKESTWIWPESYWRPSESAWMTAHKFGFLNGLAGDRLGRALGSSNRIGQDLCKSAPADLFRRIANERSCAMRPKPRQDSLRAFTLEELFGEDSPQIYASVVRFCPVCIVNWFHASIFQISELRICPFHCVDLVRGCPQCGKPILVNFWNAGLARPLHCTHCGQPFAGRPPLFMDVMGREADRAVRATEEVQRDLVKVLRSTRFWPLPGERILPGAHDARLEILLRRMRLRSCLQLARKGSWLQLHTHEIRPPAQTEGAREQTFVEAVTAIRSLGRYLARFVRGHCGHRQPSTFSLDHTTYRFLYRSWDGGGDESVLLTSTHKGVCACCLCFARWRASLSAMFDLYSWYRKGKKIYATDVNLYCTDPTSALDLFSVCVVQVGRAMGVDLNAELSKERVVAGDRSLDYLRVWPPPLWTIPRWSDGGSLRSVGYSLVQVSDLLNRLAKLSVRSESLSTAIKRVSISNFAMTQFFMEQGFDLLLATD